MNPNAPTIPQVEAAVRAVLAERHRARSVSEPGVDVFAGRLLSERHVQDLDGTIRTLRLAPGTVVTPLARDLLKRRGVEVRFIHQSATRRGEEAGEWGFAIEVETGIAASLRRALLSDAESWSELGPNLAARWVAEAPGRGAAVLTSQASLAVWRACHVERVRGACASDADAVARAIRHLGVNYLAVEPSGQTIHSLRQMFTAFRRGGAPKLPEGLEPWGVDDHEDCRGDRPGDTLARSSQPEARPVPDRLAHAARGLDHWLAGAR